MLCGTLEKPSQSILILTVSKSAKFARYAKGIFNLEGSFDTICAECKASVKSDYNFKVVQINKIMLEIEEGFNFTLPKIRTCARCGRQCFVRVDLLCWFCDESLDVEFGENYLKIPQD
jgi:hypothetical protein